jgi:hypothetical protein
MSNPTRSRRHFALGGAGALVIVALGVATLGSGGGSHRARPAPLAARHAPAVRGLVPDPEEAQSSPATASTPAHANAITPSQAVLRSTVSPGAPSDAEVRAELRQLEQVQRAARKAARPGTIDSISGTVTPPPGLPVAIARVIAGANAIATFPYRFGGGHGSFVDNAYDCSGSLSYALAAAGLLNAPLTSGELAQWGAPGPGRYLTVFANAGHTFMYVDGLRYDTSGRSGVFGTRWQTAPRALDGFTVRHWPGL